MQIGFGDKHSPCIVGNNYILENTLFRKMSDSNGLSTPQLAGGLPFRIEHSFPRQEIQLTLKRILDITLASMALILLSPLLLAAALAIALTSKGSPLFIQNRPGLHGKSFPMFKFRTMYCDAGDKTGVRQTVANDPRVTPLGAWLRRLSVDELPQLINIVLGHMSIVGPRPHPAGMSAGGRDYRELVPYYDLRTSMRPGLSGWAQVNGYRGPTSDARVAVERINHDLAYIQNFSLWLDAKIVLGTIAKELGGGSGL